MGQNLGLLLERKANFNISYKYEEVRIFLICEEFKKLLNIEYECLRLTLNKNVVRRNELDEPISVEKRSRG